MYGNVVVRVSLPMLSRSRGPLSLVQQLANSLASEVLPMIVCNCCIMIMITHQLVHMGIVSILGTAFVQAALCTLKIVNSKMINMDTIVSVTLVIIITSMSVIKLVQASGKCCL